MEKKKNKDLYQKMGEIGNQRITLFLTYFLIYEVLQILNFKWYVNNQQVKMLAEIFQNYDMCL